MTPEDRKAFAEVVIGFAELRGKSLSAPAIELYWRALEHWPLEAFKRASEHLLRTCDWMPTPKQFEDLRNAGRLTASEAWLVAMNSTRTAWTPTGHVGGTSGNTLIDQAVMGIGGYAAIAQSEAGKLHFLERRFADKYEQLQDVASVREALPQITGTTTVNQLLDRSRQRKLTHGHSEAS